MEEIRIRPIGIIHTPFTDIVDTPIQPIAAKGIKGRIEVLDEFVEGLSDLEGFSHITLLYHFHKVRGYALKVISFMDTVERGVFATKAPKRPSRIGLSTVRLIGVSGNILEVEDVDMLDGTPLIDIKPFFPRYDNREDASSGWLEQNKNISIETMRADNRFEDRTD